MRKQGITRIYCLLDTERLSAYDDLLEQYRRRFRADKVSHAPIPDFEAVGSTQFEETILPFLRATRTAGASVVVHYSAGSGRTGHVLVLWLVAARGYPLDETIETIQRTGRNPLEGTTKAAFRDRLNEL